MKKTAEIELVVKPWEKKYGMFGFTVKERENKEWEKLFSPVIGKRFTINVLGRELRERRIDNYGRIFLGHEAMRDLEVGDVVVIYRDEKRNYYLEKKL